MVPARSLSAAQDDLRQAQRMLHDLNRERREAAKAGTASKFTPSYLDSRLLAIQTIVNKGLLSGLKVTPRPSCRRLEVELRTALGYGGQADPNTASVICSQWEGGSYYIVGYVLNGAAAYSRSWIGVFSVPLEGSCELLAAAENTLPNRTVALEPLLPQIRGNLSFLVHGVNWGDAHNRLTAIVYSFDGHEIRPVWSLADLSQGQIEVQGPRIKLTYLSSPLGPGYESVKRIVETYEVTPSGVELREHSETGRP
jgi:hypothetical protein